MAYPLAVWTQTGWDGAWPPPGSHERGVLDRLYWGDDHLREEACPEGAYRPPFIYNGSGSGYLFGYKEDESLARAYLFASAWLLYHAVAGDDLTTRRARGQLAEGQLPPATILWRIKVPPRPEPSPSGYALEQLRVVDALGQNPAFRRALEDANRRVLLRDRYIRAELRARPGYECPHCGVVSFHPADVADRFCAACHRSAEDG